MRLTYSFECLPLAFADYKTDTVIQTSLRTELPSDTTCLIVAHRLQSVMDADKIVRPTPNIRSVKLIWFKMVLDAGRIVGDKTTMAHSCTDLCVKGRI